MAVAWSATKLGRATVDVTVRDPVVLTATLPRFLLTGDQGTLTFDLDNVEGPPGDYTINVKTSGPVKVAGNATTTIKLAAKQRRSMALTLGAGGSSGATQFDIDIKGPNGLTVARHYDLEVKPGDPDPGAALCPNAVERREPDADLGHVLRPRGGDGRSIGVRRTVVGAGCGECP